MAKDGKSINRKSAKLIHSGNGREANKLIKVGEWYYLVFSEHKPGTGRYVMARRSKKLFGPYKEEKQLALASREAMEPNQGGIIQGKDEKWYFLTHHGTGDWSGRIVSLLPVIWIDGWPLIGKVLPQQIGTMQWEAPMPAFSSPKLTLLRSDDFDSEILGPQWQWNYQPRKDFFSLTERPGWMRLKAFRPIESNQLLKAGNTLTQRTFRKQDNEVIVKMDISQMADGQRNAICHFSSHHSALGVVKEGTQYFIEYRNNGHILKGNEISTSFVWFKTCWGMDGKSQYYYSLDGDNFIQFGEPYQMVWGNYRGDRIGIYCFNDKSESGYVDIDYLHYR